MVRVKIPGRCFSLRSLLRDALMLLSGTVMGILLSRAIFDAPPTARLAISKRFSQVAVQLDPSETGSKLGIATPTSRYNTTAELPAPERSNDASSNSAVTRVVIGPASVITSRERAEVHNVVNISTTKQRSDAGQSNGPRVTVVQKNKKGLISMEKRPATLTEELGGNMRQPLFVGVVTSKKFLLTRARAINSTWGGKLGANIRFFSSDGTSPHKLPVVSLPGTDDTYPPQKKVYRMLKYMYDHFINEYNWFMRADDDLYVRVGPLIQFLNTLDPSTDLYIGQPGIGKADDWERIQLYPNEHYCMGGPGVILSRSLLVKLAPHLDECLSNVVVSWNEDLEVGRCIMRRLGVQCTWSYEVCVCVCYKTYRPKAHILA